MTATDILSYHEMCIYDICTYVSYVYVGISTLNSETYCKEYYNFSRQYIWV